MEEALSIGKFSIYLSGKERGGDQGLNQSGAGISIKYLWRSNPGSMINPSGKPDLLEASHLAGVKAARPCSMLSGPRMSHGGAPIISTAANGAIGNGCRRDPPDDHQLLWKVTGGVLSTLP